MKAAQNRNAWSQPLRWPHSGASSPVHCQGMGDRKPWPRAPMKMPTRSVTCAAARGGMAPGNMAAFSRLLMPPNVATAIQA